jgi:hypothetical protein
MSNISIDKPLAPGEKATFIVEMSFYGYAKKMEFNIEVPNAAPLLSRVDNIRLEKSQGPPLVRTKKNFPFSKYSRESLNKSFYRLKLFLNNPKQAGELQKGEEVILNSSNAIFSNLNGIKFQVLPNTSKGKTRDNYVHLKVPVNRGLVSFTSSGTAAGSIAEVTGETKTVKYTVTIPEKVSKGLISERIPGKAAAEGMIVDLPIFAFKKFKTKNSASVKTKLMIEGGGDIDEKNPPPYHVVREEFTNRGNAKKSYSRNFPLDDEEKFIFFVGIARYIYDGESWKQEWVQTDASDKVIWGRAKGKSGS